MPRRKLKAAKVAAERAGQQGPAITEEMKQAGIMRGSELPPPRPRKRARGGEWTSTIPQIASEDVIAIGDGHYAHFRRDRRDAEVHQVHVVFTGPEEVEPDSGLVGRQTSIDG